MKLDWIICGNIQVNLKINQIKSSKSKKIGESSKSYDETEKEVLSFDEALKLLPEK